MSENKIAYIRGILGDIMEKLNRNILADDNADNKVWINVFVPVMTNINTNILSNIWSNVSLKPQYSDNTHHDAVSNKELNQVYGKVTL